MVRKLIPEAEVFVAEENEKIQGFIGLTDTYIAGIFVKAKEQSKGIGTELLRTVMKLKDQLQLKVYKKNKTVRVLKLPKTESSIRKVFLPKSVAEMLVEWKKGQDKIKEPDICSEMQRGNIGNLTEIN